jgi:type IV pilus assembly protein PilV
MAAVVILMVGLLGLLQTVNVALSSNMVNQLRNEAVAVADQELSRQIIKGYSLISTNSNQPAKYAVPHMVLGTYKNYSVTRSGQEFSNSRKVDISVSWKYKNMVYTHEASAVVSQNQ